MSSEVKKAGSAAEMTARHVEDLILEGSLRPGDPLLSERDMAQRLNVSRPTLRQGIKVLEDKGLIRSDADGIRRIAPLATSITDPLIALMTSRREVVADYLELRGTLEAMAARSAALRANDIDRANLTLAMERIDAAHHEAAPNDEADADIDLHLAIYEASHNVVLLHIMRALSGMLRTGVFHSRDKLYSRPEIRGILRAQHRDIYEAIMARNADAASHGQNNSRPGDSALLLHRSRALAALYD